jgi:adenine-specific DNA-methyltransferase
MASLFEDFSDDISLLDPGAGVGSLTAAFVEEFIHRSHRPKKIDVTAYEIESIMLDYLETTFLSSKKLCSKCGINLITDIRPLDFIQDGVSKLVNRHFKEPYTHIIMNPPYKKINSNSDHRKQLRSAGMEASNIYSGFLTIAIKLLKQGGELVAIVPRSFCNGPYFKAFRELLLGETALRHLHVFESRTHAFKEDRVLQENIIFHTVKGGRPGKVKITASNGAAFQRDKKSGDVVTEDMSQRIVRYSSIVKPDDPEKFIHIATTGLQQRIIDKISTFSSTLVDLGIEVSTGPVVDFRMKEDLIQNPKPGNMPLLYPTHFKNNRLEWPKESKKPNAIRVSPLSKNYLWLNAKNYVITRRFTSKEEKRRVVASVYDSSLPGELVGFENHLNVFHINKKGFSKDVAKGLALYLNSTLLDSYFRQFNGHTQVNATDLRSLFYPNYNTLKTLGKKTGTKFLSQQETDDLLEKEINIMGDPSEIDPIRAQQKIDEALLIVKALGLPRGQHNERSALTLLAILNLKSDFTWQEAESPLIRITPIMKFCRDHYKKDYAPNTRETFRRQTMHQFMDAGIAIYNPDKPDRPVNSPKACYQISPEALKVIKTYGTDQWDIYISTYLKKKKTLSQRYAKARNMEMIPVEVAKGTKIKLTPGEHSQLIRDIIKEFAPRFAPGSEVIYVGDTGDKNGYFQRERLNELGIDVDKHGKMPDVVLYYSKKNWLLLIESVTSHGPVDSKRHNELSTLFQTAKPGLVYVTAFPDRGRMAKYITEISWETEVWAADSPTHLIHFNGDKFLGPWSE